MYAYTTGTLGTLQDTITYTYGNTGWKDQLTNYDGTAISYDASGNPTNWIGNLNTLTWTGRQLSSISMPNNQRIDFKYNSDGIRTYKYFIDNDEMYLYQHDYMLEGSTIVGEKVTYNSYYEGMWTKYKYYYYDENGSPIGMGYEGKDYYFQKNILGDIEAIYQGSTKVVQYTYDAWGNVLSVTGTLASTVGQENPFRYRGYYYDTETGLYYLNSRYYDPQVGRFINVDSRFDCSTEILFCNLFVYCANNCVIKYDPLGKDAIWLQDTDNVYTAGHTGLLLEDDDGSWYHFYWGNNRNGKKGKSGNGKTLIQYSGDINLKSINDLYLQEYGNTYEKMIYFEGDFSASISYINELLDKNKSYSLIFRNCVQVSATALSKGTFKNHSSLYKMFLIGIDGSVVPNVTYLLLQQFDKAMKKKPSSQSSLKRAVLKPLKAVIIF